MGWMGGWLVMYDMWRSGRCERVKAEERILVAWWFVTRWTGRTWKGSHINGGGEGRTEEDEGDAGFGVDPSLGPSVRSFVSWVSSSSSTSHILVSWFGLVQQLVSP